jgi:hypothetical protein
MAREAAVSRLQFFLDRGLSSVVVPGAPREAGWPLENAANHGAQATLSIDIANARNGQNVGILRAAQHHGGRREQPPGPR